MLVNGVWQQKWSPYQGTNEKGEFLRQTSSFRHWITPDGKAGKTGKAGFKAETGRYHLYVAFICPWACRVLTTIALKGLNDVFTISVVDPRLGDEGWIFSEYEGSSPDSLHHSPTLHHLYSKADSSYTGKATVPLLWDKKSDTAVNNESADIIEMLNNAFEPWAKNSIDLRPKSHLNEILTLNQYVYENLNNGVYRCGFAQSQNAYETAFEEVFTALHYLEACLENKPYLMGDAITEIDVRVFVTLMRFDVAYYGLFKTNLKRIVDYPHLSAYVERIYDLPGISETVNLDHIKQGYYSIRAINPSGIVPVGPTPFFNDF